MTSPCEEAQQQDRDIVLESLEYENFLLRQEIIRISGQMMINQISNTVLDRQNTLVREENRELARQVEDLRRSLTENLQEKLQEIINRAKGVNHEVIHGEGDGGSVHPEDFEVAEEKASRYAERHQLREDMGY